MKPELSDHQVTCACGKCEPMITVDESMREEFKKIMGWDEDEFQRRTIVINDPELELSVSEGCGKSKGSLCCGTTSGYLCEDCLLENSEPNLKRRAVVIKNNDVVDYILNGNPELEKTEPKRKRIVSREALQAYFGRNENGCGKEFQIGKITKPFICGKKSGEHDFMVYCKVCGLDSSLEQDELLLHKVEEDSHSKKQNDEEQIKKEIDKDYD